MPVAAIAERVGLTSTPCWRRIQKLEEAGIVRRRVALLDRSKLNLGVTVFVAVRTNQHNMAWYERFARAVSEIDEIVGFYRMSGEVDYLLHVVVPDIAGYDAVDDALADAQLGRLRGEPRQQRVALEPPALRGHGEGVGQPVHHAEGVLQLLAVRRRRDHDAVEGSKHNEIGH